MEQRSDLQRRSMSIVMTSCEEPRLDPRRRIAPVCRRGSSTTSVETNRKPLPVDSQRYKLVKPLFVCVSSTVDSSHLLDSIHLMSCPSLPQHVVISHVISKLDVIDLLSFRVCNRSYNARIMETYFPTVDGNVYRNNVLISIGFTKHDDPDFDFTADTNWSERESYPPFEPLLETPHGNVRLEIRATFYHAIVLAYRRLRDNRPDRDALRPKLVSLSNYDLRGLGVDSRI